MGNTCGWSAVKPFFRSQGAVKVVCHAEKYADGAGFSHGTVHVIRVVVKTSDLVVTSNDTAGLVFIYSTVFVDFESRVGMSFLPWGTHLIS